MAAGKRSSRTTHKGKLYVNGSLDSNVALGTLTNGDALAFSAGLSGKGSLSVRLIRNGNAGAPMNLARRGLIPRGSQVVLALGIAYVFDAVVPARGTCGLRFSGGA